MLGRRGDTGTFFETLNSSYSSCPSRLLQTALPNLTELPGGSGGKGPLLSPSPRDWKKWGWSGRRFRRRFNKLFLWKGLTLTPGGLAARRFSAATTQLQLLSSAAVRKAASPSPEATGVAAFQRGFLDTTGNRQKRAHRLQFANAIVQFSPGQRGSPPGLALINRTN